MIIRTERLILRPFIETDIKWYYDFVQDEELQKRLPSLAVDNFEQAVSDIEIFEKGDFVNDFYFVIEDKANNVIGIIAAVRITSMTIDVSYFLSKQYRHKGYMTEALKSLVAMARKENPVYRFRMVIDKDNKASMNVVKRLGAAVEIIVGKYVCYV